MSSFSSATNPSNETANPASTVRWDGGRTYATFDNGTFNAVDCVPGACYAAGAQGRMARLLVER